MSWACDIPAELLHRPVGLIVLSGLDLVYNAVHKAIWDSFSNNRRADRVPLKFVSHPIDHEYPKRQTKRTPYEYYIPKGILKSNWMSKHLDRVPAVVVIFFDLDWEEPMWKERQMECATRVEIVRNSLLGRGSKVCMVLLQKNAPLPPGEDLIAAERAASLCSACELSAKSLFVLPLTDHLLGYTVRLENAFFELSQSYYHTESRRVKSHRDLLNKTTHQLLFIRHQFKIAFYNELKQDPHLALKHYKQAYTHVWELRIVETHLLEVKTIAGFINYKICRLSFQINTPLDAIAQFRKHIDFFKAKTGIAELSFEHSAWMAKQFQIFGDLFDEAIKLGGLTAIQTQHPGFYYQQSAYHSMTRKQLVVKLQLQAISSFAVSSDVIDNLNSLDYYGQRPWRQGIQSNEPPDSGREKEGTAALQVLESKVDHSWVIIPLLGSAMAQFKKYKSSRMKRYLRSMNPKQKDAVEVVANSVVQMGEEYYYAKDYTRALTLLSRVTWEYRHERWWSLLTSVLVTQLRSSYLIASLPDYIAACLELVGGYVENSTEDKSRIYANLLRVLSGAQPDPEPGCEAQSDAWNVSLTSGDSESLTIEMLNMASFIECKALFTSESYTADKPVSIEVNLKSSSPATVTFTKLYVTFGNPLYNGKCISSSDISIEPGEVKKFSFSFVGDVDDIGNVVEIKSVCLEWSGKMRRSVCLHWTGPGGDAIIPLQSAVISRGQRGPLDWNEINVRSVTRLLSRDSSALDIDVRHCPPGLVNERYRYAVTITNNESSPITEIAVSFDFKDSTSSPPSSSQKNITLLSSDPAQKMSGLKLDSGGKLSLDFYSKASKPADLILVVKVSYEISVVVDDASIVCRCHAEQNICLSVVEPLAFDFQIFNMQYDRLDVICTDSPFIMLTDIRSLTSWPLRIESSRLVLSDEVVSATSLDTGRSQLTQVQLKSTSDHASECHLLNIAGSLLSMTSTDNVLLGHYVIALQRDDCQTETFELTANLPAVNVASLPLGLELLLPNDANVESMLTLVYSVRNTTSMMQDVDISVESSENFMFAGNRQVIVRLLPNSVHRLTYNLVPLMSGNLSLPKLRLGLPRWPEAEAVLAAILKMVPSSIFVQPRRKLFESVQSAVPVGE